MELRLSCNILSIYIYRIISNTEAKCSVECHLPAGLEKKIDVFHQISRLKVHMRFDQL